MQEQLDRLAAQLRRLTANRKERVMSVCHFIRMAVFACTPFLLLAGPATFAASYYAGSSGDWTAITWYQDAGLTTAHVLQPLPGSADDIFIQGGRTVAYDISGSSSYNSITVEGSSTFGYKLVDGVDDQRTIRLTGNLSYPGNVFDLSALYIGSSFQGATIEAGDDFKLIFDTLGAGLVMAGGRQGINIAGYSPTNQNVEIAGAGGGVYGQINSAAGRRNMIFKNTDLNNLTLVKFGDTTTEAGTKDVGGNYLHAMAPTFTGFQPLLGSTVTVDNNILESVATGVYRPGSQTISNHVITGLGGSGRGFDFDQGGDFNSHLANNSVSGFDRGIYSLRRTDITMANNEIDGNNYGLYWLFSGGDGSTNLTSVGDKFGTNTPNTTYDLYFASLNNGPSRFNFDGTILASKADPLDGIYFQFNNSQENWIAFRDFNGTLGDYRLLSSNNGLNWNQMVFLPRATDTLTLENRTTYSTATPSTLALTENVTLAGVVLKQGTILRPAGFTVDTGSLTGTGILDLGADSATWNQSGNSTFSGAIVSTGGQFIKDGAGTLTLAGTGTISATLVVGGGELQLDRSVLVPISVNAGATLSGTGVAGGAVAVADGGILSPGTSPGTLTTGDLVLANGSVLEFELGPSGIIGGGINDLVVVTGDLTLDGILNVTDLGGWGAGSTYRLFEIVGGGSITDNGLVMGVMPGKHAEVIIGLDFVDIRVIPEPTTASLLALAGLAALRRRRLAGAGSVC